MKQYNINDQVSISVHYAGGLTAGYGHKKITVELECDGEYKKFNSVTSDMPAWDAASDLEGQEKYEALYEIIEQDIESEVNEWILGIKAL